MHTGTGTETCIPSKQNMNLPGTVLGHVFIQFCLHINLPFGINKVPTYISIYLSDAILSHVASEMFQSTGGFWRGLLMDQTLVSKKPDHIRFKIYKIIKE